MSHFRELPAHDDWLQLHEACALQPRKTAPHLLGGCQPLSVLNRLGRRPPLDPSALAERRALLARLGVAALPFRCSGYPRRLERLVDPPPLLLARGHCAALLAPAIAIVGARAATAYGRSVAEGTAREAARAGLVVVSGLARGVDAAAHRGALAAGGLTVAVQACGPDKTYPAGHRSLANAIARQGCLVTELPPGTPPLPAYFPMRNRVIAGLARAVVVVEARERSGSLITARHALDLGIEVLAVPGPIDAPTSRGTNALIRDGATPLLRTSDLLQAAGLEAAPAPPVTAPGDQQPGPAEADAETARILAALSDAPAARDELAQRLGRSVAALALPLCELELTGRVREDRDGRLRLLPLAR